MGRCVLRNAKGISVQDAFDTQFVVGIVAAAASVVRFGRLVRSPPQPESQPADYSRFVVHVIRGSIPSPDYFVHVTSPS